MTRRRARPSSTMDTVHAAARGAIAAMAMTGMRTLTTAFGLVEQTPPTSIATERASGLIRLVPRHGRRGVVELAHWAYGSVGGTGFALLPERVRQTAWAGTAYGLLLWLGFDNVVTPALRLSQAHQRRSVERVALAVDHLLYGLVLSEIRRRPQR